MLRKWLARHFPVNYHAYLHSPKWRAKVKRAREKSGKRCHRCGATQHLEGHHRTYERLGYERQSDIEILCHRCHEKETKKQRTRKRILRFLKNLFRRQG